MNEESVRKRIHQLLDEIQTKADPALLNRYRSLFRKEVSFFRRSYMAAYLLFLAEEGFTGRDKSRRGRFEKKEQRPSGDRGEYNDRGDRGERTGRNDRETGSERGERDEGPRYLPEDQSVRLFISIGRNRRIFPREIL
ncbi:MAG: RNA-binding protein, partial [Treponema sp.]|nr:RNA-binding protein [Treponema sp.]